MGGRDIVCSYAGCGCGRVLSGGPVYEKIRAAGVGGCEWGEVDERMIVVTVQPSGKTATNDAQKLCFLHNFALAALGFSVTFAHKKHLAESKAELLLIVTVHSILYLTSPRQNAIMKKKKGGDKAAASWPLMIAYAIISRPIRCREAS